MPPKLNPISSNIVKADGDHHRVKDYDQPENAGPEKKKYTYFYTK